MKLYKFTRSKFASIVPEYDDIFDEINRTGELVSDIIMSEFDVIPKEENQYLMSINGRFYLFHDKERNIDNFEKSEVIEGIVVPETKLGIDVFDSTRNGKKIYHLNVDDLLYMDIRFTTDENENVWVKITYRTDSGFDTGYICYKNKRNNYANVFIPDFRFSTVLTNGTVDKNKIDELKAMEVSTDQMVMENITHDMAAESTKTRVIKTGEMLGGSYKSGGKTKAYKGSSISKLVAQNAPAVVQNLNSFPPYKKKVDSKGNVKYKYNYEIDYSKLDFSLFKKRSNQEVDSNHKNTEFNNLYYNRFKLAMPDDILSKGFMHVIFTRPDLNLWNANANSYVTRVKNTPYFNYMIKQNRGIIDNLYLENGQPHEFNMLLSNKARSFNLQDDVLETSEYGKTYKGQVVVLGRNIYKSISSGQFEINFTDNRNLDILNLCKIWIQYIHNVSNGIWNPKTKYIYTKTIDYAVACYVILTAEDFETVIYFTKYFGVFPVMVPYSALSWTGNDIISTGKSEYSITFNYSWKEEYNPLQFTELNLNCFRNSLPSKPVNYVPTYNCDIGAAGNTWVGAPFIETISTKGISTNKTDHSESVAKLRFRTRKSAKE